MNTPNCTKCGAAMSGPHETDIGGHGWRCARCNRGSQQVWLRTLERLPGGRTKVAMTPLNEDGKPQGEAIPVIVGPITATGGAKRDTAVRNSKRG